MKLSNIKKRIYNNYKRIHKASQATEREIKQLFKAGLLGTTLDDSKPRKEDLK